MRMKANVVTIDADLNCMRDRSTSLKSKGGQDEMNATFTKKLRLKDLLINKKNMEKLKKRTESEGDVQKLKDTHFLYDFREVQVSKGIGEVSKASWVFRKLSNFKKRSISQQ